MLDRLSQRLPIDVLDGNYNLDTKHHSHLVLECMRLLNLKAGEIVRLHDFYACAIDHGADLSGMGDALIHAAANGWVLAADNHIQLTESGYRLLYPANDNQQDP